MTKPREKTREELQAEIEDGKKKIRQLENREKIIKQKLSVEERKARNHRLCKRGGFMESLVPELIAMPDEDAQTFFRLALTSEPAQEFLKKRAEETTQTAKPYGTPWRKRRSTPRPNSLIVLILPCRTNFLLTRISLLQGSFVWNSL